jgi:hypothetical protein
MATIVFTLLFVDLFDCIGTVIGVTTRANMIDADGKIPGLKKVFMVDSVSTAVGAAMGTSTVAVYVESAAGVNEGGDNKTLITNNMSAVITAVENNAALDEGMGAYFNGTGNQTDALAFLAYMDTLTPPTQVKPAEGIFVEYAPIDRIRMKPVPPASEDDAAIRPLLGYFGTQDAKVLEYWYDNSLFSGWKKPPVKFVPDAELVRGDCAYYKSAGFSYITSFACFLGEDYESLYGSVDITAFGKNF